MNWAIVERLLANPVCQGAFAVVVALIIGAPVYFFGLWWITLMLACGLSFTAGWASARRHWRKRGFVPKL